MGKYKSSATRRERPKPKGPHFIWNGLGCLMIIILPVISYAAGYETIKYGLAHDWSIPYQLLGTPRLPEFAYNSDIAWAVLGPLTKIKNLYAYAALGLLYLILFSGLISVLYAAIYRMIGPSRWGPLDVPPPKIKTKKYTR